MKQLKKLPSVKNPTRLIYAGLAIWWLAKIAYQFIEGWHWNATEYGFEWCLLYAGSSLVTIGLLLHWLNFKDILAVYDKQMIKATKTMLAEAAEFNSQTIEADEYFEDLKRKNRKAHSEVDRLKAEVEFYKGQTKGYQRKSEQSDGFSKAMELLNGQLIDNQKSLNKTIDSQDKTIKLLVKSQLETSRLIKDPLIVHTRGDDTEIILYPESNEHH